MFRTDLLSIIRSLNTVYTTIGICHASYVDCLLARLEWNLASRQSISPPPVPPHVLMNFRGFPPGCRDSVADF